MDFDKKDGFSYLDNIPFKIASAFLPPPPVVLPAIQNTLDELSLEKFQYDFSKERNILEDVKSKEECMKHVSKTENMCNKLQDCNSIKSSVQNILSLQSDILLPKTQKSSNKVTSADERNNSKINLSDFENDTSSPFDYMELQTINDLEELSNVFQGLNNKYSSDDNVYKDKTSAAESANENSVLGNVSKSMSFPLQNNDTFESSEKYLTCPNEMNAHGHSDWSASLAFTRENRVYSVPHTNNLQEESPDRTLTSAVLPKVPCLSTSNIKNNNIGNGLPDTETKSGLRGCKSYSNIHKLSENSSRNFAKQERSSTPPSDTFTAIEKKSTSSLVHENEVSPSDASCDNSSNLPDLPDPYNELNEGDQKFVDAIADMGFPRAQVSRSVKHMGSDEKTVVEHLCQIQILGESGYDCLEAEAALHLHDYNQDEAKKFLDLINKFQDLGFEKNAVKKALIQNKNDWSKTIDALLS